MKALQVAIFLIYIGGLMGIPEPGPGPSTLSSSPPYPTTPREESFKSIQRTRSNENMDNFKPNAVLADQTFEFANPMKFDADITYIKNLATKTPIHAMWLNAFADMAKLNKEYAENLKFKFLPFNKVDVEKLRTRNREKVSGSKQKTLDNVQGELIAYENVGNEVRTNLTNLIETNLFMQFNEFINMHLERIVQIKPEPPKHQELNKRFKRKLVEFKKTKKSIDELIKKFKKRFSVHLAIVKPFLNLEHKSQDFTKFFDLFKSAEFQSDQKNVIEAFKYVHQVQKLIMNVIKTDLELEDEIQQTYHNITQII